MKPRWQLTVEDAFAITGRGTVVVGPVDGVGYNEAAVVITPSGETYRIAKVWFELPHGRINDGTRPTRFGLVVGDIDKQVLTPGTIVRSID